MATLDSRSAFDLVDVELLKRLNSIGFPNDISLLVSKWLTNRYFYASFIGENSVVHHCKLGTLQGSILRPILYVFFVSPLFDLAIMTMFTDDT